jgi:hypothetical protein
LTCTTQAGLPHDRAPSYFVTVVDYRFGAFIPQARHSTESFKKTHTDDERRFLRRGNTS